MARAYGNERTASATIRLTQQERAVIQRVAYERNMRISDVIREAIAQYCEDKEMKRVFKLISDGKNYIYAKKIHFKHQVIFI